MGEMITWVDKLKTMPVEKLKRLIEDQKAQIRIKQSDLEIIERVLRYVQSTPPCCED